MVFAHAGHWAIQLLYLAPVLVIVGMVAWNKLQEKRGKRPARHDENNERSSE